MAKTLDSFNTGSNYNFADKLEQPRMGHTPFPLSHVHPLTMPPKSNGMLVPVLCQEVLPTDSWDLSVSAFLRVLPQVVPMYSNQRISFHAFYCRNSDVWSYWNAFMRKGYNGDFTIKVPSVYDFLYESWKEVNKSYNYSTGEEEFLRFMHDAFQIDSDTVVSSSSLLHYLYRAPVGVNLIKCMKDVVFLPYAMYIRIWRDYYCNPIYYLNNRVLFPNAEQEFIFNKVGGLVSGKYASESSEGPLIDHAVFANFFKLHWRDFPPDYFTSAYPSPQRGQAATISANLNLGNLVGPVQFNNPVTGDRLQDSEFGMIVKNDSPPWYMGLRAQLQADQGQVPGVWHNEFLYSSSGPAGSNFDGNLGTPSSKNVYPSDGSSIVPVGDHFYKANAYVDATNILANYGITLNAIRELAISQTEMEKLARTDGSYREFGLSFFGIVPRNSLTGTPTYIGGAIQSITYTEVIQTAPGTSGVLGSIAGHGVAGLGTNAGYLGRLQADDYGFCIVLASVMPDVYYSQGLPRAFTRFSQAQYYMPTRAQLGAQPILQKEIYYTGNSSEDEKLFGYADAWDEYRFMDNYVSGKIADPTQQDFFPLTQSRLFTSAPTLSQSFATTENNIRYNFLSNSEEVPYSMTVNFNIRASRPLPYRAIPARII